MFKVAQSTVHQSLDLSVCVSVRVCKGLKTILSALSQMPPAFLLYFRFFIKYFLILSFPNNSQILPNYLPSQLNGSLSLKTETTTKQKPKIKTYEQENKRKKSKQKAHNEAK